MARTELQLTLRPCWRHTEGSESFSEEEEREAASVSFAVAGNEDERRREHFSRRTRQVRGGGLPQLGSGWVASATTAKAVSLEKKAMAAEDHSVHKAVAEVAGLRQVEGKDAVEAVMDVEPGAAKTRATSIVYKSVAEAAGSTTKDGNETVMVVAFSKNAATSMAPSCVYNLVARTVGMKSKKVKGQSEAVLDVTSDRGQPCCKCQTGKIFWRSLESWRCLYPSEIRAEARNEAPPSVQPPQMARNLQEL